ncbi:hypothetical protein [Streptomyces albireticuli]|uniref:hypothetical protein n=1 Tax=Streptomyces albireticuli TaxID=1940 RepID=UPI0014740875|nr:hypothetical protein [Streptomyces albireticuli]MCD9193441.1 hypothetical protein [Streptomyces albireticuli]
MRGAQAGLQGRDSPTIGETWTKDFGSNTPITPGPFVVDITYTSASRARLVQ